MLSNVWETNLSHDDLSDYELTSFKIYYDSPVYAFWYVQDAEDVVTSGHIHIV